MNKKQTIGLIVAAVVFVFVSASSVVTNYWYSVREEERTSALDKLIYGVQEVTMPTEDFIGIVGVDGAIVDYGDTSSLVGYTEEYDHQRTLDYIDQMMDMDHNKGILLRINSPGGGVYESDELYLKLMEYKEYTDRPVWAYMEQQACSGGYYIAMAADEIYANRNAYTGSIGVIISTYNFTGLYEKLGIKEINITSGTNKAMGSAGEEMTEEQQAIFQSIVDESYDQFVEIVADGRNISKESVLAAADGRIYTAKQAQELDLIDEIGSYEELQDEIEDQLDQYVTFFEPTYTAPSLSSLFLQAKETKARSESEVLLDYMESVGREVPMYYAGE